MLEEFEEIVGTERYTVFMEMLEAIGPDALEIIFHVKGPIFYESN